MRLARYAVPEIVLCLSAWGAMSACTSGEAMPIQRAEAGVVLSGAGGVKAEAGSGGRGGAGAGVGGAAGGMSNLCFLEPPDAEAAESAAQLLRLINEAVQEGELCVDGPLHDRSGSPVRCPLLGVVYALAVNPPPMGPNMSRRGTSFLPPPMEGWSSDGWVWHQAENAAEAKSLMLSESMLHSDGYRSFCNAASRDHYTDIVVVRWADAWGVQFLAAD
jgi:hypothetical protein